MSHRFGGKPANRRSVDLKLVLATGVLLLGVSLAVLSFFVTKNTQAATTASTVVVEREADPEFVRVVVPIQPIDAGTPLEPAHFGLEEKPKISVSTRAVLSFEELRGGYARSLIVPDQPLTRDFITNVRPTNLVTANIPEGFRAVTIRVDQRTSVEGWARAGARVDVVWTSNIRGRAGIAVIVENAEILSAERNPDPNLPPGTPIPSTVTLKVTAPDANKIQLASTTGAMSLSLRGERDHKASASNPITVEDLIRDSQESKTDGPKPENIVKMRDSSGNAQEFVFRNGRLEPRELQ